MQFAAIFADISDSLLQSTQSRNVLSLEFGLPLDDETRTGIS